MSDNRPLLVVDEYLFLGAIKLLADQGEKFDRSILRTFTTGESVASRFSDDVGREIKPEEQDAIGYYVAAVDLVHHHSANLEQLNEVLEPFDEPALAFIRTAAWSFVMAWSLRYGGLYARHADGYGLIDPTVDDVKP